MLGPSSVSFEWERAFGVQNIQQFDLSTSLRYRKKTGVILRIINIFKKIIVHVPSCMLNALDIAKGAVVIQGAYRVIRIFWILGFRDTILGCDHNNKIRLSPETIFFSRA
jgi:hypothetical protein